MSTIYNLIQNKVKDYVSSETTNNQSVVGNIIRYIEGQKKLREPQREAIEVYLWLKFIAGNQRLSEIIRSGILYDDTIAKQDEYYQVFQGNYTTSFLSKFAQDNNLPNLLKQLLKDPQGKEYNWDSILDDLLHNFSYPNYLYSLPMGAGKTYLMACFIYLDLFFASFNKKDKRFAHNFVVFAPQASKTAILPSLQTIKNFDPEWILPHQEAERLKKIIHIEILDALSSQRKDKLHGNNPNLEKVNLISQYKKFGLIFITNAEKVVLEKYDEKDKIYLKGIFYDAKKTSEIRKINELREGLSQLPNLTVILDEVHHAYGRYENKEKKLRQAVSVLNQHNNVVCVLGLSGTPYVRSSTKIGKSQIRLNQIQDIVYNYSLAKGIGKFLKVPAIKSVNINESQFIKKALNEFFEEYDLTYANDTKSKITFYCPTVKKLNEDILPVVQDWYRGNRKGKEQEIFRYYSAVDKKNKQYELPKENLAIFNNLDKPYSSKRVILLVAVGTEGWDCKSLTSVVLPRQKTTKNFVLQTTCRCLREIEDAKKEKALILLEKGNYETLNKELKENYNLTISDLRIQEDVLIPVNIRKPKLGKLQYKQIYKKFAIITKEEKIDYKARLKSFDFASIKKAYPHDLQEIEAKIGEKGLTEEKKRDVQIREELTYSFEDFIYDVAKNTYGKYSENELLNEFETVLHQIHGKIIHNTPWLISHPYLGVYDIVKKVVALLMREISYKTEIVEENVEIELLEWRMKNPSILFAGGKFLPEIKKDDLEKIRKRPNRLKEDFEDAGIDPFDISFNYIPYRVDSDFEKNALLDLLKQNDLRGLEVYYNGYRNDNLSNFWIRTPYGNYTPDFLVIKRDGNNKYKNKNKKGNLEKVLIIETKGKIYYNEDFKNKEKFVKDTFLKFNPKFRYIPCVDEEGKNDFSKHLKTIRDLIKKLKE